MRHIGAPELSVLQKLVWGCALLAILFVHFIWIPFQMPTGEIRYGFAWDPPRGTDPELRKFADKILNTKEAKKFDPEIRKSVKTFPEREGFPLRSHWSTWVATAAVVCLALFLHRKLEYR